MRNLSSIQMIVLLGVVISSFKWNNNHINTYLLALKKVSLEWAKCFDTYNIVTYICPYGNQDINHH